MTYLLIAWLLPANLVALDNDYVVVARDAVQCASAGNPECGDRVIVALGDIELRSGSAVSRMTRGDVRVFSAAESYEAPVGGSFFEVVIKPNHPPIQSPRELIAPEKNAMRYDGDTFFIFEERLAPGETRPRHSHSQRIVIQLNRARLQQWPEGQPAVFVETVPERPTFSLPVIHTVENVGDVPLRGIVIEFKPQR